jgi:hypothetical protein
MSDFGQEFTEDAKNKAENLLMTSLRFASMRSQQYRGLQTSIENGTDKATRDAQGKTAYIHECGEEAAAQMLYDDLREKGHKVTHVPGSTQVVYPGSAREAVYHVAKDTAERCAAAEQEAQASAQTAQAKGIGQSQEEEAPQQPADPAVYSDKDAERAHELLGAEEARAGVAAGYDRPDTSAGPLEDIMAPGGKYFDGTGRPREGVDAPNSTLGQREDRLAKAEATQAGREIGPAQRGMSRDMGLPGK